MVDEILDDMYSNKENPPEPMASKKCFDKPVFCGAGEGPIRLVHARLDYALSLLSGIQQLGYSASCMTEEEVYREIHQTQNELAAIAEDLLTALGVQDRFKKV